MCTSLLYFDIAKNAYLGRTLELSLELPYQVTHFPVGEKLSSSVEGFSPVNWTNKYNYLAITMPAAVPTAPLGVTDLKVVEAVNSAGLTFSVQAYSSAGGLDEPADQSKAVLSAVDLGAWVLGQFSTVDQVKAALAVQEVIVAPVPILGGTKMPFHYSVHDATGKSIVIQFHQGVRSVYDNPVGVLTNMPEFNWHLVNLNNYTFLSNVDHSKSDFLAYKAQAPGSGIAKAGLPVTDTSVDRFIRAAFYSKFAEPASNSDKAVQMVAHIMNNFDRPRGITIDPPDEGSDHMHLQNQALEAVPTEYTSWTSITDLGNKKLYIRDSGGMNFFLLDLASVSTANEFKSVPLAKLAAQSADQSSVFH